MAQGQVFGYEQAPPCRAVTLAGRGRIPYWKLVYAGAVFNGVKVLYSSPPKCWLTLATRVVRAEDCKYRVERISDQNIALWEECGGKAVPYVYPTKVYDELERLYLKPILEGDKPVNNGILLVGAPGTGKSKLAEILARMLGFAVFKIRPDTVLSKYVGESERNLARTLEDAKNSWPSMVILDDAEWLLSARKLASLEDQTSVLLNMQNIIFDEMQRVYNEGLPVLFVATTNVKPSEIDPALLRYGRFGKPILIPIPDYEALYYIYKWKLGNEEEARRLAWKAVNMGLGMADALTLADMAKAGLESSFHATGGRGYSRINVEKVDFSQLLKNMPSLSDALKGKSRIFLQGHQDVMTALAVQLAYAVGKTVIKIVDPRFVDEAVHTAGFLGSVIIADTFLPTISQAYIYDNYDGPVIFVGYRPPVKPAYTITNLIDAIHRNGLAAEAIKAVAAYKGINVKNDLIERAAKTISETSRGLEALLASIAALSHLSDRLVNEVKATDVARRILYAED